MHDLKSYLETRAIKQKDAAAALGVSPTYLSKVLNGHWPVSLAFVGRVAVAYPEALPMVLDLLDRAALESDTKLQEVQV